MSRSRTWVVAGLFALLTFGIPFSIITASADRHPEIQIIPTGNSISALIVDGEARLLVINSSERGSARSAFGKLMRPWEPDVTMVIAPASDPEAAGLWEALQHPAVEQVIVAGLPGAAAAWSAMEREARDREISIEFAAAPISIGTPTMQLELHPGTDVGSSYLLINRSGVEVVLMLGTLAPEIDAHAIITPRLPEAGTPADLVLTPSASSEDVDVPMLLLERNGATVVVLEENRLRVRGGRYVPASDAN